MAKTRSISLEAGEARRLLLGILSTTSVDDLKIKGNMSLQKIIDSVLNKEQRERLSELSGSQKVDFLREQTRAFAERRGIETAAKAERAGINAQEKQALTRAGIVGKAEGEIEAERLRRLAGREGSQSVLKTVSAAESLIGEEIEAGLVKNEPQVRRMMLDLVPAANNERTEAIKRLETSLTTHRSDQVTRGTRELVGFGIPSPVAQTEVQRLVAEGKNVLNVYGKPTPTLTKVAGRLQEKATQFRAVEQLSKKLGYGELQGPLEALKPTAEPAGFFGRQQREAFKGLLESSGRQIAGGAGEAAVAEASTAAKALESSTRLRRLGGAGLIAALILPSLINAARGRGERQQSPAEQIQLFQALGQLQQNQQLTQSLVQSRDSQAALNLAKAQMLQLQAAGAGGGQRLVL